ncbi:MAG: N(G),N(G)-dimethylarginine dimethylaminohydrolase [Microbacteriaceae bacterium]|jgi:dimethylargininase|nr:N(G),N(G)-dimethylarginine dimethylaminohydrolase [Microbacteriaceae bacterium]
MSFVTSRSPFLRRILGAAASALVVALAAHVVSVLAFFVQAGAPTGAIGELSDFFALSSVLLFAVMTVFGSFGVYRHRAIGGVAAFAASVAATLVGAWITITIAGTPLTVDIIGSIAGLLTGAYLLFVLAATVAGATIASRTYRWFADGRATAFGAERRIALIRRPSENLADGTTTHIDRVEIDPDLADEQWERYVEALEANGWTTEEVEYAPELADSVFIEDAVVLFGRTAVLARPGLESRVGEVAAVEAAVRRLGYSVQRIEAPGTLDGGDVLKVGDTVYVGRGGRTNAEGIRQLRNMLYPLGHRVVAVPTSKVLHLKSAVTALPDGTVIGYPPLVDDSAIFDRFLAVPEEAGAHVVVLAADTVLMAASAPASAELIADLGYRVITVDISEFEKLEGCVTCLSVRVR